MRRVCIASIQNVERSLLLLVVSASDIPLRTIKIFSVLFSSACSSMLQAITNKHSLVRRRLCDLHCMVVSNCFVTSLFARPAIFDIQLRPESRFLPILHHLHSTLPLGGFPSENRHPVWYGKTRMVWRLPDGEKILTIRLLISTELTNVTDTHTDRHHMTA